MDSSGFHLQPNRRRTFSNPSPFEQAILPPADESEAERAARVQHEREAKAVSDGIDAQIALDKQHSRKRREVKVLLLGQSESGKSTTLKRECSLVV
jgi:tRNA U34 5-carboxymethylaminomethyl modifying GTPase MnmE/TrmE